MHSRRLRKTWNPNWYTVFISQRIPGKAREKCHKILHFLQLWSLALLTSATLIHFSSSRALCWPRSVVGRRQDAKTALANLLNWRMVARTDQQTPSLPFLSLCDHSEPRQWYGTRRTNSSWSVTVCNSINDSLQTFQNANPDKIPLSQVNILPSSKARLQRGLTVSILVSCSAMSAAGNPRILVGSNSEASGGGLVKPVWAAKGEAV